MDLPRKIWFCLNRIIRRCRPAIKWGLKDSAKYYLYDEPQQTIQHTVDECPILTPRIKLIIRSDKIINLDVDL